MAPRCPNGTRRNKKTGNCEPTGAKQAPKTAAAAKTAKKPSSVNVSTKAKRCPKGSRRNKKTGNCESSGAAAKKVRVPTPILPPSPSPVKPKYAAHVKATLDINGNFKSVKQLDNWFRTVAYMYVDRKTAEEEMEIYNFKYTPYLSDTRHNEQHIDIEFDTDLIESSAEFEVKYMADLDEDGNYPVNGQLVSGEVYSFEYTKN